MIALAMSEADKKTTFHGRNFTDDETEFIQAMRKYIEKTGHKFPAFSEHLHVLKSLGYQK